MRIAAFLLSALLLLYGCGRDTQHVASPNAKRYQLKGKVVKVDKDKKKAAIAHEKIEGFMDAMTMDFPIHADWVWKELSPGAEINAELVVDNTAKEPFWLENLTVISSTTQGAQPPNESFGQIGQEVPKVELTNQDGNKISLQDFRGKALAVTFIYARCPLPDYCIRMSTNFSDAANQIKNDPDSKGSLRLLSISFDPANDTPEKLKSYGMGYFGKGNEPNFEVWQLAVGKDAEVRKLADFFGLRYEVDPNDRTLINHSLRTAVIDPAGKLKKMFPGNDWTPQELISEMRATLDSPGDR
jgi:protein SCO1